MVHVVKVDEMKRERKTQSVEEENRVQWEIVATGEYSCRSEVVWTWQLPNNKWWGNIIGRTTKANGVDQKNPFASPSCFSFSFSFSLVCLSLYFSFGFFFFLFFFSFNYSHLVWILWLVFLLIFYKFQNPHLSFSIIHFNPLT